MRFYLGLMALAGASPCLSSNAGSSDAVARLGFEN
jgi:hypothetical protein